mgnify:CR=1 FL=1
MYKLQNISHKPPLPLLRKVMLTCLLFFCAAHANAQEGLAVNAAFQQYGHSKGCKMVVMQNTKLRGYHLNIYKSLVYPDKYADKIGTHLKTDRRSAKKIREIVDNGRIASGYYMMPPLASGANRYILFSHTARGKGAVIYIEGNLSPDDIMSICYTKRGF